MLMPRVVWPLCGDRPAIPLVITSLLSGIQLTRMLLADSGAGSRRSGFELFLDSRDCLRCGKPSGTTQLTGAYGGWFPVYRVRVKIPGLGFDCKLFAVAVPTPPPGFDGVACFKFLNRFTYGNFG